MCRAACARNDNLQPPVRGPRCVVDHAMRRAVRGDDGDLVRNPEFLQQVRHFLHDREIGIGTHDDAYPGCTHAITLRFSLMKAAFSRALSSVSLIRVT